MARTKSPTWTYLRSADGLFLSTVVLCSALGAIACAATGHFFWMVLLALLSVGAWKWLRFDVRRANLTPEELAQDDARLADEARRARAKADAMKAERREAKYGPPPPGVPVVPGAHFVRIREMRWSGLPGNMPLIDLVCGACAYGSIGRGAWSMPRTLVSQFQTETGPGSGMAAFNNVSATARRNAAIQALTCPHCGSIDPGVWVQN